MNAVVFEHVPVAKLPLAWREKLVRAAGDTLATFTDCEKLKQRVKTQGACR